MKSETTFTRLAAISCACAAITVPAAGSAQSSMEQPRPEAVEFSWKGTNFSLEMPDEYCLPNAEQKTVSEQLAAGDSQNETLVDLHRCGTYGVDYILIKTPRTLPPVNIPREEFIRLVANEVGSGAAEEGLRVGQEDVERMSDGELTVTPQDYSYAGYDDQCMYMAGSVDLVSAAETVSMRVGSCLTLVERWNLAIHVYNSEPGGASVTAVTLKSRAVAGDISTR